VKAAEVQVNVKQQKKKDPENEYIEKIEEKVAQVKKEVENGDQKGNLPFIMRDLEKTNQKLQESILSESFKSEDPNQSMLRIPAKEMEKNISQLNASVSKYKDVKQTVKDTMIDMVKNAEKLLGLEGDKSKASAIAGFESKDNTLKESKAPSSADRPMDYSSKNSKDSFGLAIDEDKSEEEGDGVRRRIQKKDKVVLMSQLDDESKEGYSFKPFTEGSEAQKILGDFQKRKQEEKGKRRIQKDDDELNLEDADEDSQDFGEYQSGNSSDRSSLDHSEADNRYRTADPATDAPIRDSEQPKGNNTDRDKRLKPKADPSSDDRRYSGMPTYESVEDPGTHLEGQAEDEEAVQIDKKNKRDFNKDDRFDRRNPDSNGGTGSRRESSKPNKRDSVKVPSSKDGKSSKNGSQQGTNSQKDPTKPRHSEHTDEIQEHEDEGDSQASAARHRRFEDDDDTPNSTPHHRLPNNAQDDPNRGKPATQDPRKGDSALRDSHLQNKRHSQFGDPSSGFATSKEDVSKNPRDARGKHSSPNDRVTNLNLDYQSSGKPKPRDISPVAPQQKSPRFVEVPKKFVVEDLDLIEDKEVPYLREIEGLVIRRDGAATPESQKSLKDDLDPEVDPCESFYEEVDKNRKDLLLPKAFRSVPVFRRKLRKLTPAEASKQKADSEAEKKLIKNPNVLVSEYLVPTDEWSKGKKVLKKKKSFELLKPPVECEWESRDVAYFNVFAKDPHSDEPRVYQDSGVIKKPVETPEVLREKKDNPHKYLAVRDPEGTIKVIEIFNPATSPLADLANQKPSKGKLLKALVFLRHLKKLHDLPIIEQESEQLIQPKSPTAATQLMDKEELATFLRKVKNDPVEPKVELLKETGELLNDVPVIQAVPKEDFSHDHKLNHIVEKLEEEGKLDPANTQQSKYQSAGKTPEAEAVKLDKDFMGRPAFQIVEEPKATTDADTTLDQDSDPVEELKKALENAKSPPEAQLIYQDVATDANQAVENLAQQNQMIDRLYDQLEKAVQKRGLPFDDSTFLPTASAMVNNSLKSLQPYKHIGWKKLSELYEVASADQFPIFLANFCPAELFPSGSRALPLVFCLASLCDFPDRIKKYAALTRLFSSRSLNREGLYGLKLHPAGRLQSLIVDEVVPADEAAGPFVLKPANHEAGLLQPPEDPKASSKYSPQRHKPLKRKREAPLEVDLWPHLLAKALSKSLGCYERLLGQELQNVMSDLTGMPLKLLASADTSFDLFRQSFKKGYLLLAKANRAWLAEAKKTRRDGCQEAEMEYWVVDHAVKVHEERSLLSVKNHFCSNAKEPGSLD